ncbi:type II secretion system minor pseudopilin GspJ [Pseudomonas akapageensis]|uniref:type II secretion system minor pseudopilin GspJ n=1 Tax=Pseudomonas akapageensis TaxID=2609961 RepID=UPI001FE6ADED|nr:type II secretion system minor pseudopilin GspJ [Pseudomonas akapageensis]
MSRVKRRVPMSQRGFTLLELLLALAIFTLLGVATWRLFDGVVRADSASQSHGRELRSLQRAMGLIERDVRHGLLAPGTAGAGFGVSLKGPRLQWLRGGERNPLDLPRSELRVVEYWLEEGTLWRHNRTFEEGVGQPQRILEGVRHLRWRLHAGSSGWHAQWPLAEPQEHAPTAVELVLSVGRFEQMRRVVVFAQEAYEP